MKQKKFADLYTPEGEELIKNGSMPWNVYPRPQMQRDSFFCLNGDWEFSCGEINGLLRVPFPPESLLSGIGKRLGKNPKLHYKKEFSLPDGFIRDRVLLHFGAVDQIAEVFLNGKKLGEHRGGYEHFSFDITDSISDKNILEVYVRDELENRVLPYGKQCEKRGGMWYTPISGIWQTVWIESVPEKYIEDIRTETGEDFAAITVYGIDCGKVTLRTPDGEITRELNDGKITFPVSNPRMWSPEDPYLYYFTVESENDKVTSYFALRTLEIKSVCGTKRLCLNGKPYFFHGLLDQGYYSDGIFTPASPKSYENDIVSMKNLGFNTLRKHIKVEPEQFYYDCDRLGMIVFQDMVNNSSYSFIRDTALPTVGLKKLSDKFLHRSSKSREAFISAMESTVKQLYNHPCICYWTIFNEGWGQFESQKMYKKLKSLDNSRFIDTASGWFKGAESDVESPHVYFKPVKLKKSDKPILLSEFGGYSFKPEEHVFNIAQTYGYKFFEVREEFENALIKLYEEEIIPLIPLGLCGDIYTQLSDVEDETNGLLSYDRKVLKVDPAKMRSIAEKLKI
ncbi:MAG: glycoside hydrolase family 2 [Ruminococcaceae bacterium]|nr:glycoside hydrolase family 2 [Oscillospiraceae bacterium]